jgi:hypothetical protein
MSGQSDIPSVQQDVEKRSYKKPALIPSDPLIPFNDVCVELSISRKTLYRLNERGLLGPITKQGRLSYIKRSDIDRYRETLPNQLSEPPRKGLAPGPDCRPGV